MKKSLNLKIILIFVFTLLLIFLNLPSERQQSIIPATPEFITRQKINLGLDLQGGSQLTFKIDLRKVPENEQSAIIDGVLNVIERRVNGLGVSEPNIYTSQIADETQIIVEIAQAATLSQEDVNNYLGSDKKVNELTDDEKKEVSLEKAKAIVGKTIQLEFKEEKKTMDPAEKDKIEEKAQIALGKIINGDDFSIVAQEEQQAYPGKVRYDKTDFTFESAIPANIKKALSSMKIDDFHKELIETGGSYTIDPLSNQLVENTGLSIIKLLDTKEEVKNAKEMDTSHILISFKGAEKADASILRTEEEAYERAKEVLAKLTDPEPAEFAALATEYSDDSSNKKEGGKLSEPVFEGAPYATEYTNSALTLNTAGDISEITKTNFGYHIIKADEIRTDVKEKQYSYEIITFSTVPDPWKETGLTGEHFVHADVQLDNFFQPYVSIRFNDEGAKLFAEITERNVGKQVAIFVGGEFISAPRVNEKIEGGSAQITGQFTNEEAKNYARDLNTGAIPAPIILTGEYTIGATLGHEALDKSLKAGAIGLLLVMLFMLLIYRIPGVIASLALISYAAILIFLIKSSLHLGVALIVALAVFLFLIMKIVNNKDSGWEKFLSFILSCAAFFFLTFLLKTAVVLTLAGIAGIILSIGMAVDANILIFERVKEELRDGKTLKSAIDLGFERAWSAIRDSNFSTLLTCAILFYFGSSIIRGFAFNLAAGILVSMFTALVVTKTLLHGFVGKKIAKNLQAFGEKENRKERNFSFIKNSKIYLGFSGILIAISLVAMFGFGLRLGIDFTGGSLMEIKFQESVEKSELASALKEIEKEINAEIPKSAQENTANAQEIEENLPSNTKPTPAQSDEKSVPAPVSSINNEDVQIAQTPDSKVDLTNIQIVETGENGYIIKTKYITSDAHDIIIEKMETRLPEFTESRFTTIGPTIGQTLLNKAMTAIVFTLILIIAYIAFAFRKITKQVSSWKFGACAIAALLHDVIIVTGFFVILTRFFNVEIDALFITAMLTVLGYSVNDTIVVFDRLRENLIKGKTDTLEANANRALNGTLTRSLATSASTLITLITVLILGSASIFYFILALTAGIVIGTYSSIFVASPLLVMWETNKKE